MPWYHKSANFYGGCLPSRGASYLVSLEASTYPWPEECLFRWQLQRKTSSTPSGVSSTPATPRPTLWVDLHPLFLPILSSLRSPPVTSTVQGGQCVGSPSTDLTFLQLQIPDRWHDQWGLLHPRVLSHVRIIFILINPSQKNISDKNNNSNQDHSNDSDLGLYHY